MRNDPEILAIEIKVSEFRTKLLQKLKDDQAIAAVIKDIFSGYGPNTIINKDALATLSLMKLGPPISETASKYHQIGEFISSPNNRDWLEVVRGKGGGYRLVPTPTHSRKTKTTKRSNKR